MTFAAYVGSLITATSVVTANCTTSTPYTISFADTPATPPKYLLANTTAGLESNTLEVVFTSTAGTMTNGAATITGTGTGTTATAGTITGTIAATQTGKAAGTYSKLMTLNIVY
jgi:hypothetical protein